jgi:hypothetical protein
VESDQCETDETGMTVRTLREMETAHDQIGREIERIRREA